MQVLAKLTKIVTKIAKRELILNRQQEILNIPTCRD